MGSISLVLLLAPSALKAQYTYTTNNSAITITRYFGPGGAVVIPSTLSGLPVTSLADHAFAAYYASNNANIASVVVPFGITNIGLWVFSGCSQATNFTIPDSVISIGRGAFEACASLRTVTIPSSTTTIGNWPFGFCTNLTTIIVDSLNPSYSSLDGVLFNKNQTVLLQFPGGKAGDYVVPSSVTNIDNPAFYYCVRVRNITIPKTVTGIPSYGFASCPNLLGVYFPDNAPNFGWSPFEGSPNATVYYLPWMSGWSQGFQFGNGLAIWRPWIQTDGLIFGVKTNQFGFNIGWTDESVVVEVCTNTANPIWVQIGVINSGSTYFGDPGWTNYPVRLYRVRSLSSY